MRFSKISNVASNSFVENLKNKFKLVIQDPKYQEAANKVTLKLVDLKEKTTPIVKESLYRKMTDANNWYTRIVGLDEVKKCQTKVMLLEEKLLLTQDQRREIGAQLAEVRRKSNSIQEELQKVKRQEQPERFFELMKQETEILKLEHEVSQKFKEYDKTEREVFTAFTNAVRDSHEVHRSQVEYTKYFGVALSIFGSFLAFVYSSLRKEDLKAFIDKRLAVLDPQILSSLEQSQRRTSVDLDQKLDQILANLNTNQRRFKGQQLSPVQEVVGRLEPQIKALEHNQRQIFQLVGSMRNESRVSHAPSSNQVLGAYDSSIDSGFSLNLKVILGIALFSFILGKII